MTFKEAFEQIKKGIYRNPEHMHECFNTLKKTDKLLNILERKRVNIAMIEKYSKVEDYNLFRNDERKLTKEEFAVLKEWLNG